MTIFAMILAIWRPSSSSLVHCNRSPNRRAAQTRSHFTDSFAPQSYFVIPDELATRRASQRFIAVPRDLILPNRQVARSACRSSVLAESFQRSQSRRRRIETTARRCPRDRRVSRPNRSHDAFPSQSRKVVPEFSNRDSDIAESAKHRSRQVSRFCRRKNGDRDPDADLDPRPTPRPTPTPLT
jgi:hypothetical protein